jgi:hypothetical protein
VLPLLSEDPAHGNSCLGRQAKTLTQKALFVLRWLATGLLQAFFATLIRSSLMYGIQVHLAKCVNEEACSSPVHHKSNSLQTTDFLLGSLIQARDDKTIHV